ncbi:MAG: hypothetical protein HY481_00355 [Candidatus Vogelbacteria bacterium]|nr:hypothetical protein [Candidatus Vogelbacteria bacterium]
MRKGTLIIGHCFSVCGDCGGNAKCEEECHYNEFPNGVGCGVRWLYVTNDDGVSAKDVQDLRPDLEWQPADPDHYGVTRAMEVEVIKHALSPDP